MDASRYINFHCALALRKVFEWPSKTAVFTIHQDFSLSLLTPADIKLQLYFWDSNKCWR